MSEQNNTETSCEEYEIISRFYIIPPFLTVVLIVLSSLKKRKNACTRFPYSRFGLLVPVNLLDETENIVLHAAAFGCTILELLTLYPSVQPLFDSEVARWFIPLIILVCALIIGTIFYPLFACISFPDNSLVAPVIGAIYSSYLFIMNVLDITQCEQNSSTANIFLRLPIFVCLFTLIVSFIYKLVRRILHRLRNGTNIKSTLAKDHHKEYMRILFSKAEFGPEQTGKLERILESLRMCYSRKVLYKCTIRTAAAYSVAILMLYMWLTLMGNIGAAINYLSTYAKSWTQRNRQSINESSGFFTQIDIAFDVFQTSFYLGVILSSCVTIVNMVQIYYSLRKNFLQLCRGETKFIPEKCLQCSDDEVVTNNLMFAGLQVGHFIYGYLMNVLLIWILGVAVAYFLILPILGKVSVLFLQPVKILVPGILILYAFRFTLRQISKFVFMQNHLMTDKYGKTQTRILALDNRNLYHIFSYFLFFYFVIFGVLKSLNRMVKSLLFIWIYLARLDRSIMIPGFEHMDQGFMSYISFLRMEVMHCHPIVVMFCGLLLEKRRKLESGNGSTICLPSALENMESTIVHHSRDGNKCIRNRWQKLYTLVKNPDLCAVTKSALILKKIEATPLTEQDSTV